MPNEGREPDDHANRARSSQQDRDHSGDTGKGSEFVGSEYMGSSNQDTGGMDGGKDRKPTKRTGAAIEKTTKKPKRP